MLVNLLAKVGKCWIANYWELLAKHAEIRQTDGVHRCTDLDIK
jgi:hypothetical protein